LGAWTELARVKLTDREATSQRHEKISCWIKREQAPEKCGKRTPVYQNKREREETTKNNKQKGRRREDLWGSITVKNLPTNLAKKGEEKKEFKWKNTAVSILRHFGETAFRKEAVGVL